MHKTLSRFAAALVALMTSLSVVVAQPATGADRLLLNGEIITMEAGQPIAQALAIRGNRIVAVGTNAEIRKLRSARTEVIDLGGKTVVPGGANCNRKCA
jgi:cytosine/adenosine deaminase-related metal-dependent hydrolase